MKAIVYENYGSPEVLKLKEVKKPIPKDNEVLIKIKASSVNFGDWGILRGDPFLVRLWSGLFKPKYPILGGDVSGIVEAIGKNVKDFEVGDEVFGDISGQGWGGYAEYVCTKENIIVHKPLNITFEEAAAVPVAAVTALQGLRFKGSIQPGQKVLINGASGGVGTFALLIAKAMGAEVTAVCSTGKIEMAKSCGADFIIDYTKEDFTKNGKTYDHIIAANGSHSISEYKKNLNPKGRYVCTGGSGAQIFQSMVLAPWISMFSNKILGNMGVAKPSKIDLIFLKELMETKKLKPVIDKIYPLEKTAEALSYLGEGHAIGKVIISMDQIT